MPAPAAAAGAIALLGKVGAGAGAVAAVTGSASDLISLGFTIADHLKAQEGLKFNLHTFKLDETGGAPQPPPTPASAGTRRPAGGKSAAVAAASEQLMQLVYAGGVEILQIKSNRAHARFVLESYRPSAAGSSTRIYVVHLRDLRGFDTEIGHQAELEFDGTEVDGGYLLSVRGIVNEFLLGFFHFFGDLLVRQVPRGSSAERVVPLSHGRIGEGGQISSTRSGFLITF